MRRIGSTEATNSFLVATRGITSTVKLLVSCDYLPWDPVFYICGDGISKTNWKMNAGKIKMED